MSWHEARGILLCLAAGLLAGVAVLVALVLLVVIIGTIQGA